MAAINDAALEIPRIVRVSRTGDSAWQVLTLERSVALHPQVLKTGMQDKTYELVVKPIFTSRECHDFVSLGGCLGVKAEMVNQPQNRKLVVEAVQRFCEATDWPPLAFIWLIGESFGWRVKFWKFADKIAVNAPLKIVDVVDGGTEEKYHHHCCFDLLLMEQDCHFKSICVSTSSESDAAETASPHQLLELARKHQVFTNELATLADEVRDFFRSKDIDLEDIQKLDVEIAVIGQSRVGKSTLLNVLLGQEVFPMANEACSFHPTVVRRGKVARLRTLCCVVTQQVAGSIGMAASASAGGGGGGGGGGSATGTARVHAPSSSVPGAGQQQAQPSQSTAPNQPASLELQYGDWIRLERSGNKTYSELEAVRAAVVGDRQEGSTIVSVEIELPDIPLLEAGLSLVDLPGVGERDTIDARAVSFLNRMTAIIYALPADGVINDMNKKTLKKVFDILEELDRPILYVVNKIDTITATERRQTDEQAIDKTLSVIYDLLQEEEKLRSKMMHRLDAVRWQDSDLFAPVSASVTQKVLWKREDFLMANRNMTEEQAEKTEFTMAAYRYPKEYVDLLSKLCAIISKTIVAFTTQCTGAFEASMATAIQSAKFLHNLDLDLFRSVTEEIEKKVVPRIRQQKKRELDAFVKTILQEEREAYLRSPLVKNEQDAFSHWRDTHNPLERVAGIKEKIEEFVNKILEPNAIQIIFDRLQKKVIEHSHKLGIQALEETMEAFFSQFKEESLRRQKMRNGATESFVEKQMESFQMRLRYLLVEQVLLLEAVTFFVPGLVTFLKYLPAMLLADAIISIAAVIAGVSASVSLSWVPIVGGIAAAGAVTFALVKIQALESEVARGDISKRVAESLFEKIAWELSGAVEFSEKNIASSIGKFTSQLQMVLTMGSETKEKKKENLDFISLSFVKYNQLKTIFEIGRPHLTASSYSSTFLGPKHPIEYGRLGNVQFVKLSNGIDPCPFFLELAVQFGLGVRMEGERWNAAVDSTPGLVSIFTGDHVDIDGQDHSSVDNVYLVFQDDSVSKFVQVISEWNADEFQEQTVSSCGLRGLVIDQAIVGLHDAVACLEDSLPGIVVEAEECLRFFTEERIAQLTKDGKVFISDEMTAEKLASVRLYSLQAPPMVRPISFYQALNAALADPLRTATSLAKWKPIMRLLMAGLEILPAARQDVLFRGIGRKIAVLEQTPKLLYSLASTSECEVKARWFAGSHGTLMVIKRNNQDFFRDISSISFFPEEAEVIIPPLSILQIDRVREDGGLLIVEATAKKSIDRLDKN